ncbi:Fanconi anemia core complex-associated protein 100 isoform X2 [Boleophthalmus pectinirostris]|uniref:Fanconi anemia core complex-associated protein 100 isoform X2 n=1 Tax=Boleophthalmus pectinirostris TaxID=150288 RepID=UPI002431A8BF|nr:Fanconi anemia core complex-associated protein 100 isoform X2 [Boleophthalmus pectinirostris]
MHLSTVEGILQFPTSVSDLIQSEDNQHLFAACRSAVYSITLPHEIFRLAATESSSPTEFKITSDHLVIREERVLCLLTVGTTLVTLSRRGSSWLLTANKPRKKPDIFERLCSFSIPAVSDGTDERRPVMECVHLSDSSSLSDSHLEPTLFKLLFGIDSALIKSPIILCGLPDGRLCSLSLHLPGIRTVHSLEEPVVFIGASVAMETEPGPDACCLVAVGEHGRVVVIKTCEGATEEDPRQVSFTEGCVPGKVMSACVDKSCLYLSTGSDVLSINLAEESSGKSGLIEERARKHNNSLLSPTSLNVCRVIALTKPTSKNSGGVELLGLSDKGQLQNIILPENGGGGESSVQQRTRVGRSVKDLLSAIGDVCQRASNLKSSIKSKNEILRHLNQVANVSFLLFNNTEGVEQPLRCLATVHWTRLLLKDSLHLTCILENNSSYSLEQGWTLNLTVYPLSDSSQEQKTSTNYSFPFCSLYPGQTFEVTLPLTAADDKLFPITISCVLVFSLKAVFDERQLASLLKGQNSTISVPLNTLAVDWLHALQLTTSFSEKNVAIHTRVNSSVDGVERFLTSKGKNKVEKVNSKPYSACIKISLDLLKHTLASKNANMETSPNLCVTFLSWLFSEPHRGVTGHQWERTTNTAVLHLQCLNGQLVKLVAKEVNFGIGNEILAVVEAQVESLSLAAVCGLHHAIVNRMQTLVKRAPKTLSALRAETFGLRPELLRAEHLLQQVQDSRISGVVGVGVSSGHVTRSLLKVYQELRQHPLVIF